MIVEDNQSQRSKIGMIDATMLSRQMYGKGPGVVECVKSYSYQTHLQLRLTFSYVEVWLELSKPQPNLNTMVGFDNKMTLHHPPHPTQTQCQQYLSCY